MCVMGWDRADKRQTPPSTPLLDLSHFENLAAPPLESCGDESTLCSYLNGTPRITMEHIKGRPSLTDKPPLDRLPHHTMKAQGFFICMMGGS